MRVRRIRGLLWAWTAGCLILSGAIVWSALRRPLSTVAAVSSGRPGLATRPSATNATDVVPDLAELRAVARVDLRRPLYDAPPPAPVVAAPPPPPPPLTVRLAGTVVEDGHSRAILLTPEGKMEFRRVGERSGDAEVLSIEPDHVTLRYRGEPVILRVERAASAKGGGGG